jgi:hypothetical protein
MQGKTAYIRPKVVGPFSEPCASGSYVHQAASWCDAKREVSSLGISNEKYEREVHLPSFEQLGADRMMLSAAHYGK